MATTNNVSGQSAAEIFAALNGSGTTSKAKSAAEEMENRFLTLLTAQLKNQDPLNPLDNAEMTSQLAQINTINGIERMNATLTKLLGAYDSSQAMQSSALIGRSVLVAGNGLHLSGGLAAGGVNLSAPADQVIIKVLNTSGKVIQSQNLGAREAGNFSFVWDGKDDAGTQLADGNYLFSVEAVRGTEMVPATALQLGTVSAVTRSNNGFVLDLGGLGSVRFDDVQQIL